MRLTAVGSVGIVVIVSAGLAAASLFGLSQPPASRPSKADLLTHEGVADPSLALEQTPSPTGESVANWVAQVGPEFIQNQNDMSLVSTWLQAQPGIEASGFVTTVVDPDTRSMEFHWFGESPLQQQALDHAAAAGITAIIVPRPHSVSELNDAVQRIFDAEEIKDLGFSVSMIGTISADPDEFIVSGEFEDGSVDVSAITRLASRIAGFPVQVEIGGVSW